MLMSGDQSRLGGGGGYRRPLPPKIHEFQARSKAKTTEGGLAKW